MAVEVYIDEFYMYMPLSGIFRIWKQYCAVISVFIMLLPYNLIVSGITLIRDPPNYSKYHFAHILLYMVVKILQNAVFIQILSSCIP